MTAIDANGDLTHWEPPPLAPANFGVIYHYTGPTVDEILYFNMSDEYSKMVLDIFSIGMDLSLSYMDPADDGYWPNADFARSSPIFGIHRELAVQRVGAVVPVIALDSDMHHTHWELTHDTTQYVGIGKFIDHVNFRVGPVKLNRQICTTGLHLLSSNERTWSAVSVTIRGAAAK
jgi:hypothetical protein